VSSGDEKTRSKPGAEKEKADRENLRVGGKMPEEEGPYAVKCWPQKKSFV